ncbi:MAG: hypothetical protein JNK82_05440 [Myxococcaceae bacterium]|nr:hypothetical protein [Myxococcaceae bacterium]
MLRWLLFMPFAACVTVDGELTHVVTRPASGECRDAPPTVAVGNTSRRIELVFNQGTRCSGPTAVYRRERHARLDDKVKLGVSLATGLGAVLPVVARLSAETPRESWQQYAQHAGERRLTNAMVTMASTAAVLVVALFTNLTLSAIAVPLPSTEEVFEGEGKDNRYVAPARARITGAGGVLLGTTDDEGVLRLGLQAAPAIASGELYVDGRRADLMRGAAGRLAALTACHESVTTGRCLDGGWSFEE